MEARLVYTPFLTMSHEIARHWRLKEQRLRLIGEVCGHCEAKIFPPRDICPNCNKEAKEKFEFSGKGEVYSFSTMYDAPEGFEEFIPYTIAHIKLAEGPLMTAQLTDLDSHWEEEIVDGETRQVQKFHVEIGMPVEMVTRVRSKDGDFGLIDYGPKFRPLMASQSQV